MYTPEEIADIFDRYNKELMMYGKANDALAKEMADAVKGVKNYTATLNNSLKQLGQASQQAAVDIANGAKGTSVFNNSIESAGGAVATVAERFGVLGKGIGLVINALTGLFTAVNKQSDALYGSFQQLSRTGAVGAQGMDDVFQNMKRFGYTINELDRMGSALAENSQNFAMFSGTAATGSKNLANMVMGMEDARVKFFNLGMTVDDIVRANAGYFRQMGSLGRANEATTAGAKAYIREMETLTRLTGAQRKELEEQRERAEMIDAFYASLVDLPANAQKEALSAFNQIYAISPKMADEFAANFSGVITGTTDLLMATSGASMQFNKDFFAAGGKAVDTMQGLGEAMAPFRDMRKELALIGAEFGPSFRDVNRFMMKHQLDFAKQLGLSEKEVADLEAGLNAATDAQSRARNAQINASNNIQSFINLGIAPATRALSYLTQVVENLTSILPGSKSKGYGQQGTGTKGGSLAATGAGAAAGATALSFLGLPGIAAGGIGGGLLGYAGYQMHGGAGATKEGLRIKSPESTAGGEASANLYALAQKIQKELGSDLIHFSAFNDSYHQGTNSVHTQGRALDFTIRDPSKAAQVAAMIRAMPGVSKVLDEYTNPSSRSTGGHIHAEINGFAGFKGRLSGPMSGYSPNLRMHGDEELSIRPSGGTTNSNSGASEGTMVKLIERVDDLIYLSRSQLNVNEKMLKYAQ